MMVEESSQSAELDSYQVNRATGAMTPSGVYELGTSPSCLALHAAETRLYSANETDRVGESNKGTVSAFAINRSDGQLKLLNTLRSGGAGPTYVSFHPSKRFVLVANYFGGSVAVLPILPDGRLGAATDVKMAAGTVGPRKATNAPPGSSFAFSGHDRTHAHMIEADPSGGFLLHVDLGLDQIFVWNFDDQKGVLTPNDPAAISLPPGNGPRHFAFHPSGRWLYSIQEEGSTVVWFDYDAAKGRLTSRQTLSTLPPGFAGHSGLSVGFFVGWKWVHQGKRPANHGRSESWEFDRRAARARDHSSPPCSFNFGRGASAPLKQPAGAGLGVAIAAWDGFWRARPEPHHPMKNSTEMSEESNK